MCLNTFNDDVKVYQVYSKRTVAEVHDILNEVDADYIILEEGRCYGEDDVGCRTRDIVDTVNGEQIVGAKSSTKARFCHEVDQKGHERLFRLKFKNTSFRVYKVIK